MSHMPRHFAAALLFLLCATSLFAEDAPGKRPELAFRLAESERAEELIEAAAPNDGPTLFLHAENVLTGKDVTSVTFERNDHGEVDVTIQIESAAAKRLAAVTKANMGKRLAILLDGKVITAPIIRAEISSQAQMTGRFSNEELLQIFAALVLQSQVSKK